MITAAAQEAVEVQPVEPWANLPEGESQVGKILGWVQRNIHRPIERVAVAKADADPPGTLVSTPINEQYRLDQGQITASKRAHQYNATGIAMLLKIMVNDFGLHRIDYSVVQHMRSTMLFGSRNAKAV